MHQWRISTILIIVLAIIGMTGFVYADQKPIRSGSWAGIDIGIGRVHQSTHEAEQEDTPMFLGFKAGYTITPDFLIGLEFSGWLFEESNINDPGEGEGLSQVFLISRIYPFRNSSLYFKFGGGLASIWDNDPDEEGRKSGVGFTIGSGYDYPISNKLVINPFVSYSFGNADDTDYRVVTFGLGVTLP